MLNESVQTWNITYLEIFPYHLYVKKSRIKEKAKLQNTHKDFQEFSLVEKSLLNFRHPQV